MSEHAKRIADKLVIAEAELVVAVARQEIEYARLREQFPELLDPEDESGRAD